MSCVQSTNDATIIRLRNLILDCNCIIRINRHHHTETQAKHDLRIAFASSALAESSAKLLSIYNVSSGGSDRDSDSDSDSDRDRDRDRDSDSDSGAIDDEVFERIFSDPKQTLLKWINDELSKAVSNSKMMRGGDDDSQLVKRRRTQQDMSSVLEILEIG